VARNRKRAKERRARRPQPVAARSRAADREQPPADPLEHAAPDVELAEAQMAVGRPAVSDAPDVSEEVSETVAEAVSEAPELDGDPPSSAGAAEIVAAPGAVAERRPGVGNRLVTFLQGSWHELQRVQWPDRRQVMQATGVVIGFVIVAGVFLGVADFLAGKLMNYVLK
jgi:preprotein translocase subunit SecE